MDSAKMLPPAVTRQLLEVSLAAMKQLRKEGKQLEAYVSPAGCMAVILEYKNAEEWVKDQNMIPILNYYTQEIYPLADMEESVKGFMEAIKAAEKMMGGAPR
jgi:predicted ATP-binding protein involved in virulence